MVIRGTEGPGMPLIIYAAARSRAVQALRFRQWQPGYRRHGADFNVGPANGPLADARGSVRRANDAAVPCFPVSELPFYYNWRSAARDVLDSDPQNQTLRKKLGYGTRILCEAFLIDPP